MVRIDDGAATRTSSAWQVADRGIVSGVSGPISSAATRRPLRSDEEEVSWFAR